MGATYRITAPDGSEYEVTPPDGVGPDEVMRQVQGQFQQKPEDPYAKMTTEQLRGEYRRLQGTGDKKDLPRIADAFVKREQQEASTLGGVGLAADDVIRQLAAGVPVAGGALDEATAASSAATGGNYEETLDYQRARDRSARERAPWLTTGLNLVGGIAGTLAGARALGVGYGANTAAPLLHRAAAGGAIGAGIGGADFFARGEGGPGQRGVDALIGAGFGGVVGAAAPVVAQGVSSAYQRMADLLRSNEFLQRMGISRPAAQVLLRQLSSDDTLTAAGSQRIAEAGDDAMLADAGPAARNLLDTALERSGPGATAAREAVEQRAASAGRQMASTLDDVLGAPVGVEARQAGIRQATAGARHNAYEAAYDAAIDYASPAGQQLRNTLDRVPAEAIRHANRLMRAEIRLPRQIQVAAGEDGLVTFVEPPDVRQLDYITRGLNEVARGAEGQGVLGGQTALGRSYGNLSREIRQGLRQLVPEYGTALETAADPIRRIQATELGARLLNKTTTREEIAREIGRMTGPERFAAMRGLRDQIDELVANVKGMASDPNIEARQLRETLNAVSADAARQKIAFIVGPDRAARLFREIDRLGTAAELRASVARNSRTFGRTATDMQVKEMTQPGVVGLAMEGKPLQAAQRFWQSITGFTPERQLAAQDQIYSEIANRLTTVRGGDARRYLMQLRAALNARANAQAGGRAAGALATDVFIGSTVTPADRALSPAR